MFGPDRKGAQPTGAVGKKNGPLSVVRGYSRAVLLSWAIGIAASVGLFLTLRAFQNSSERNEKRSVAIQKIQLLQNRIESSMEVLYSIQSLCTLQPAISRQEFHTFVTSALARRSEIQALSWNPCVPRSKRPEIEVKAKSDGMESFTITELTSKGELISAAPRDSYVPIYYLEPLERNRAALGFDLAANVERRLALNRARDSGVPSATKPLRLVQEPADQLGFVVVLPVFRGPSSTTEQRRANLAGFVSAVFRMADLVHASLGELSSRYSGISIYDLAGHQVIFTMPSRAGAGGHNLLFQDEKLEWTAPVDVAGLRWKIVFSFSRRRPVQPWAALFAGLIITALTAGYIARGERHTAEIEARVKERTAELANEIAVRKATENNLREAERNYRSIFENSIEGIFQSSPDGHHLRANPALARIYGYDSPEELVTDLSNIGRQLYVDPARRAEFIRAVHANGSVSGFESQIRRKDGRVIWISENARGVHNDQGELLYYEGTVEEITDRKQLYEALEIRVRERTLDLGRANEALRAEIAERKRAEIAAEAASKAKSEFLAHMSHEIRTPLNAILGYAQILQRDVALQPKQQDAVEAIASSGNHLFGLIDEILDLSKIEAGRMELQPVVFDLHDLIARLESMFRHRCRQKRLKLLVEMRCQKPCMVQGDEGKLRQILINLLGNAVKFTESGQVRLEVVPADEDCYEFKIADTGIGISDRDRQEIFLPFQQAVAGSRKGGTGLGLTISNRYIALLGGRLDLESTPGVGSVFSFVLKLPAAPGIAHTSAFQQDLLRLAPGQHVKALVVDDIKYNRDVLSAILSVLGCEVLIASSGEQAIAIATAARPDIIFMDIWMDGINGIEATQRILAECGQIKFVAHSASAFDHEQKRYLDAGFDDFFAKPFRVERICECLRNLLHVEFVSAQPRFARSAVKPLGAALPADLLTRLRTAAELCNVTGIKECLPDVVAIGENGEQIAAYLGSLINSYEMESILSLIAELEPELHANPEEKAGNRG
jgi:PAS domain S-box-containing protein